MYAAVAMDEHDFNLRENLPSLTQGQVQFIYNILKECLNRRKMELLLQELLEMEKQGLDTKGLTSADFKNIYQLNFSDHVPKVAIYPEVGEDWLRNLARVTESQPKLLAEMKSEILKEFRKTKPPSEKSLQFYLALYRVQYTMFIRLFQWRKKIFKSADQYCRRRSIDPELFQSEIEGVVDMMNYDTREIVVYYILKALEMPDLSCLPLQQLLGDILKKSISAGLLFRQLKKEQNTEVSLFLASLYYKITSDDSDDMLAICRYLKETFEQNSSKFGVEIVHVRRIQFEVRWSRKELDYKQVQFHFDECLGLLGHYDSYETARTLPLILRDRTSFYHAFEFPFEAIRNAHIEYEQCRQFYIEIDSRHANRLVVDICKGQVMKMPQASNDSILVAQELQLNEEKVKKSRLGCYKMALQTEYLLETAQRKQQGLGLFDKRMLEAIIAEADLLLKLGKYKKASELLLPIKKRVSNTLFLGYHRDYYMARAQVHIMMEVPSAEEDYAPQPFLPTELHTPKRRYKLAMQDCLRSKSFSKKLSSNNNKKIQDYRLEEIMARICLYLREDKAGLDRLNKARTDLLQNPDLLASNSGWIAEALRLMNRLEQSADYCEEVFKLERQNLIPKHHTALAHRVKATIAESPQERLEQSWAAITATTTLGDEESCLAFTNILEHYLPIIGNEALSLISYARKSTDPPRSEVSNLKIADVLCCDSVPAGFLPFDMPTPFFVRQAQTRLGQMSLDQHLACYEFKLKLLDTMPSKYEDEPHFRLHYLRTMVQTRLHLFMSSEGFQKLIDELPGVIRQMVNLMVPNELELSKWMLLGLAESIFVRCNEFLGITTEPIDVQWEGFESDRVLLLRLANKLTSLLEASEPQGSIQ